MFRTFVVTIAGFLLFGVLTAWVLKSIKIEDIDVKRGEDRAKNLTELRKADDEVLNSDNYVWIDKSKGVVRLPLKRALELTATELATKKPREAGLIPPSPSPSPEAAASPS